MLFQLKSTLAVVLISSVLVGGWILYCLHGPTVISAPFSGPLTIEGLEGEWYIAGPFADNETCPSCVIVRCVKFTFLFSEPHDPMLPDAPDYIHIRVDFSNNITEEVEVFVGGYCPPGPRFYTCERGSPTAVIITHMSTSHTDWYSWYYAVSAA